MPTVAAIIAQAVRTVEPYCDADMRSELAGYVARMNDEALEHPARLRAAFEAVSAMMQVVPRVEDQAVVRAVAVATDAYAAVSPVTDVLQTRPLSEATKRATRVVVVIVVEPMEGGAEQHRVLALRVPPGAFEPCSDGGILLERFIQRAVVLLVPPDKPTEITGLVLLATEMLSQDAYDPESATFNKWYERAVIDKVRIVPTILPDGGEA